MIFGLRKIVDRGDVCYKNKWLEFHPEFRKANIVLEKAGYFDSRPQINFTSTTLLAILGLLISPFLGFWFALSMITVILFIPWGQLYLHLPYDTGINECDPPRYGFYFYGEGKKIPDNFVICQGKKSKHIDLPWSYDWFRTSRLLKDGAWIHERKGDIRKGIYIDVWQQEIQSKLFQEMHPYVYKLKNREQQIRTATIKVEEREWRPKWFMWTNLFSHIRRSLDVEFSEEVGERSGSWKGGTIGCSYDMKSGESPYECLMRMEQERVFR